MQLRINKLAIGAGLVVMAAGAVAQDAPKPVGLSLRAGVFMPTDSGTRSGGNGWFAAGVEYKLMDRMGADGQMDHVTLSLDYASKNNFRVVPVLVNYVRHRGPIYISLGVGASFSRRPIPGGVEDRTRFGYAAALGYDFNTASMPLFGELRFLGNEKAELNGFGVYVGVRF